MTTAIGEDTTRPPCGPDRSVQGLARACRRPNPTGSTIGRPAPRRLPEASTTPPADGAQLGASRSPSTTSCASPSSRRPRRPLHRGAGRAPTPGRSSSSAGADRARPRVRHPRGVRVAHPPGEGQGRRRPTLAKPARRQHLGGASSARAGLPRHRGAADHPRRGWPMVADSVEVPRERRPAGVLRRRALLRRLQAQPEFSLPGASRPQPKPAPRRIVLCDTNGGALPFEVEVIVADVVRHLDTRRACTCTTTPAAAWQRPRRRAGRRHPGAGDDQRLRRAHRQLQPVDDHPQPQPEDGRGHHPRRSSRAAHHRLAPRGRGWSTSRPDPSGPRGLVGVRPQGGPARERHRPALRRLRAHPARRGRQRHRFVVSEMASKSTLDLKARDRPRRWTARSWLRVVRRLKTLGARGFHFGRPTARSSCSCGMRPAGKQPLRARVLPGDRRAPGAVVGQHRARPAPRWSPRRRVKVVRRPARHRDRRGQRPVQRPRPGLRRPSARPSPALGSVAPHRLQGAVLDTTQGTGRSPGAHRLDRRRPHLVDHQCLENVIEASWQALADSVILACSSPGPPRLGSPRCPPPGTSPGARPGFVPNRVYESPPWQHDPRVATRPATSTRASHGALRRQPGAGPGLRAAAGGALSPT